MATTPQTQGVDHGGSPANGTKTFVVMAYTITDIHSSRSARNNSEPMVRTAAPNRSSRIS